MEAKIQHRPKTIILVVIGLLVFFVCAFGATYVWAGRFDGRIAPNVTVGPVDASGLNPETARQILQTKIDQILLNGIEVRVGETVRPLSFAAVVSSDSIEDIKFDLDRAIKEATYARRSQNPFLETWLLISNFWQPIHISLPVTISQENVKQNIARLFPDLQTPPENSRFIFEPTQFGWSVTTTEDREGLTFDWDPFITKLLAKLMQLDRSQIDLLLMKRTPQVTRAFAQTQTDQALLWLSQGQTIFSHEDLSRRKYEWTLSEHVLATMLSPQVNGEVGIDKEAFDAFLNPIALQLELPAQDARLQLENGKVVEFVGSQNGLRLEREKMYDALLAQRKQQRLDPISLILVIEKPAVQTKDVNDLGIDQILGTGISSYRGSPQNRRKNIQNGVNLLNGILIAPGDTFSLVNALKPFEIKNGYLPELVIKGNKITPELGGGLCQIGTTTFRATMNSGLPILERQNHSIVVSYYNDPANQNPGTDATIYEPAPDFKFLNDTGHYVLFQAENLTNTQELRFTFWGTSDGRKGSYVPPTVTRWIPVGETQYVESVDLESGKEKCQEAHIGADAHFDYTIVRPDGTQETTTFTSHYRPLPRICLIGVAAPTTEENLSTEPVLQKADEESKAVDNENEN